MKKFLVLTLVVLALICALASCGGQEIVSTTTTTQQVNPEPPVHTHNFGEWEILTTPTCTQDGEKVRDCACGEMQKRKIEATRHIEIIVDPVEATCTTAGLTEGKECSVCGAIVVAQEVILAKGHAWSDWITVKNPTTKKEGLKERTCYCGERETESIAVLKSASEGLEFMLNDDGVSYRVTGIGTCTDAHIVIPATYNNMLVTSIGESAFGGCTSLISIEIPDFVTSIGARAFNNCRSLASITIPNSITSIGNNAFNNCYALIEVCNKSSFDIKAGSTDFGYIGYYARHIIVDESQSAIKYVGDYVFFDDGIEVYLVKYLGNRVELTLPDYKRKNYEIWQRAFYYNHQMISVTIPENVTSIGNYAFEACFSLVEVCNKSSMKLRLGSMGDGCVARYAEDIIYDKSQSALKYIGDYVFYDDGTYVYLVKYLGDETKLILPDYNEQNYYIGKYVFYRNGRIISIIIPPNVTHIDDYAFYDCTLLRNVMIPDSVTSIGEFAFGGCTSLLNIVIPNSVKLIEGGAFCDGIATLPPVFYFEATGLPQGDHDWSRSTLVKGIQEYGITTDGWVWYSKDDRVSIIGYIGNSNTIEIPTTINNTNVNSIGSYAFRGCSSLTSVTIPDSITSIGEWAFSNCTSLTNIAFGDNSELESIGKRAFYLCKALTSIVIPNNVTNISSEAFYGCTSLVSVTIPKSVTIIGESVFGSTSKSIVIYCEAESQPSGWDSKWNYSNRPVVWGYKPE